MTKQLRSFYSLSVVTDDWLDDNNLHNGMWAKGLKWAIRGLKRVRLDSNQQPITALLPVTERKTIVLPEGYVDWVKLAVKKGQYAITLSVNDELTSSPRTANEQTVRGLLSQNMPNGTDFGVYGGYQFLNYAAGSLMGIGHGLPGKGYFKIVDHGDSKEAFLDYDYNFNNVYLEYISDGIDFCGESFVHPYEYEFIIAFMDWMYERKNNPKATRGSIDDALHHMEAEERRMRGRFNDLGPKDFLDITRNEARLTTKL
jgi:hypothetical protein